MHGATCVAFRWDDEQREAELDFVVQRADKQGVPIERPITIRLNEVVQLAAYVPAPCMIPGKNIKPGELASRAQLKDWTDPDGEIQIDSRREKLEFESALQTDWILTTENVSPEHIVYYRSQGGDLLIGCQLISTHEISTHEGDRRIALSEWSDQHACWVKSNDEKPDNKLADGESQSPNAVCESDRPQAEIFPSDLDAPTALLRPIKEFLEGIHDQDWQQAAEAFPDLDRNKKQVANSYASKFENGPWLFARHIDDHWHQNRLGFITVRGVEFDGERSDGEHFRETVVSYELRRLEDDWIIWNFSQGWVKSGTAPALSSRQPWHDEFEISSHKSDNAKSIERVIKDEDDVSNPTTMLALGVVALFVIVVMRCWLN